MLTACGAKHRDLQPLLAVRDREPLRERERGVLGHRIRRAADLREQSRGRRGVQQVAAATIDHAGNEDPSRIDVREHVDTDAALPIAIGRALPARQHDAHVGAEQIDRAEARLSPVDQRADLGLVGDIARHHEPVDVAPDLLERAGLNIGHGHAARAFGVEAARERSPDARGRAGDHDVRVLQLHSSAPVTMAPSSAMASTIARPPGGRHAATSAASFGSTNAATDGPEPESHAAYAPARSAASIATRES